jgi:hypothetical protein
MNLPTIKTYDHPICTKKGQPVGRLDLRRLRSVTAVLDLVVEDEDKVGGILIHAVFGGQEQLATIALAIVDEGSSTDASAIGCQQHRHRVDLSFLSNCNTPHDIYEYGTPAMCFSQATSTLQDPESPKFFVYERKP